MSEDILFQLPTTMKARTEEMVIRNAPGLKSVGLFQCIRPVMPDGTMGEPIKHFMRNVPVDEELLSREYAGITGMQVLTWLTLFANGITNEDAPKIIASMQGIVESKEPKV